MKQQITAVGVIALIALGMGVGGGMLMMKTKLDQRDLTIEELQAKVQQTKTESEEVVQKASAEIAKLRQDLLLANRAATQYKNDLTRAAMEIDRLKTAAQRPAEEAGTSEPAAAPAVTASPPASPAAAPTAAPAANVPSVEYIVKDGDSLWKIAAAQLGSGIRYKEILSLNPQLTENSSLVVGAKIRIPAK